MATVLRRLSKRLRNHDWLAVLFDLAIVVGGVFLGIQAANWNAARQSEVEERRYYAQLSDDLRTDVNTLRTAVERSRIHDRAAENVLAALDKGLPATADYGRLAIDFHKAGFLFVPQPARRSYDELISTGNLGILRNDSAKRALASYYESFASSRQWDALLREQQSDYWRASAGVVPRHVLRAALQGPLPPVSRAEAEAYLREARKRPEMRDMLIGMAAHQERVRRDSEGLAQNARKLIGQLEPLARQAPAFSAKPHAASASIGTRLAISAACA